MAVGDLYQARIWSFLGDQAAVCVRHYRISAQVGTTVNWGIFLANVLDTTIVAAYKALLSSAATYRGVDAQRVWPFPPLVSESFVGSAGLGSVAGDALPTQVSGLIKFTTALAGRKYRGRLYMPFPGEIDSDVNGKPITTYVTRLSTLGGALLGNLSLTFAGDTATAVPIIPGKTLVPGSSPKKFILNGTYTDITGRLSRLAWATQRKRGGFGQKNVVPI